MTPEQRAAIEFEVIAEVADDLRRRVLTIMRKLEGDEWPRSTGVDEFAFGFADDGRLTFHVGDAAYLFARGSEGRIVESRPTRVRLLGEEGVIAEREYVRPALN
jgi:hypothetical protein